MIGVIVAVVASQIIGTFWYSTYCLGGPWMRINYPGKTSEQIGKEGNFTTALVICMVSQVCLALVLHYLLLSYLGITCMYTAVKIGVGLGVAATLIDVSHCVFSCRSAAVFVIDHMYDAVVFTAMCVSLVYFK